MNQSLEIYLQLREQLLNRALPRGFAVAEERREDSFGSHFITLTKNQKAIRLVWSGHDYTFSLETTNDYEKQPLGPWNYLVDELVPFLPWSDEVISKVLIAVGDGIAKLDLE